MAEGNNSTLKAVVGWAGGIAAAVITAVLIARLSPSKPDHPDHTDTTPVTLEIDGYVLDSATHAAVRNANVSLTLGKFSGHQRTDITGKYNIVLDEPVAQAAMSDVAITAPGYQAFQNTLAVSPPNTYAEILIDAIPPAPAPPQPGVAPTVAPLRRAQILIKPLPSDFVRGPAATMTRH